MAKRVCTINDYICKEAEVEPGTKVENIPDNRRCPAYGMGNDTFGMV